MYCLKKKPVIMIKTVLFVLFFTGSFLCTTACTAKPQSSNAEAESFAAIQQSSNIEAESSPASQQSSNIEAESSEVLQQSSIVEAESSEVSQQSSLVEAQTSRAEQILSGMTLEEKISQMIIPAFRTWDKENVTDLSAVPELAEALRAHQYGGIILFGANVSDTKQLSTLLYDLQVNNAKNESASANIPYFLCVDEEGGIVTRLTMGTRMTGNMAIGATGENAEDNAFITGEVIGEELKALGFNVDFAPDIDVNSNAANPVIGTRSFSNDASVTALLGYSYVRGLEESRIIATYKHFPGHGDTSTDSHIGTPSSEKTYDQIKETELIPFAKAIESGADLIMTAHITYPSIDEDKTFGDGKTAGSYPATMSRKMVTDILRVDLGYEGVVVTDALEMDAIRTAGLVPGEPDSAEYKINIAQEVINAGVDILLLPMDMTDATAVAFYDEYIAGLEEKVNNGSIDEKRIDESVLRILKLKEKYGILDTDTTGEGLQERISEAQKQVGSDEHHKKEMEIARQAITLVKNEDNALPVKATNSNIVILGRNADDNMTIAYTIRQLQDTGVIDQDAEIINLVTGETTGVKNSGTHITIDYYYDPSGEETQLHYTEELKQAISEADIVIGFSKTFNLAALEKGSAQYQGIANAIEDAHAASAKFILLSNNLPYDAARYQDADAIILAYMGSGLDMDPTARSDQSANLQAYNANVTAALQMIFGEGTPQGKLPVNIPKIAEDENGLRYTDEILYERGYGIGGSEPVSAGYETTLFDTGYVHQIDIRIAEEDWNDLQANAVNKTKYKVGIQIDGEEMEEVSFATKGNSSLIFVAAEYDLPRYSFKINFGKYVKGQTYHGLNKLSLNNSFCDATYMKDHLCYDLFREAGTYSPLTSYVWLTINGRDQGLYLAIEDESESFLARTNDGKGVIYKPESKDLGLSLDKVKDIRENGLPMTQDPHGSDLIYKDDDPATYPDIFENAETDSDEQSDHAVLDAIKCMAEESDPGACLDTEQIIRFFAAHNFVLNLDSYTGAMLHNLVLLESDGLLALVPWDYNLAYCTFVPGVGKEVLKDPTDLVNQGIDSPLIGTDEDSRPMWRWIVKNEKYLSEYHDVMDTLISEYFESGEFSRKVDDLYELLLPYVQKDPTAFYTAEEFKKACDTLKQFCERRAQSIRKQLDGQLSGITVDQADPDKVDASDINILDMGAFVADVRE